MIICLKFFRPCVAPCRFSCAMGEFEMYVLCKPFTFELPQSRLQRVPTQLQFGSGRLRACLLKLFRRILYKLFYHHCTHWYARSLVKCRRPLARAHPPELCSPSRSDSDFCRGAGSLSFSSYYYVVVHLALLYIMFQSPLHFTVKM